MAENEKLPSSIWSKLLRAKELVGVVKKDGKVAFKNTNYNYQKAEDIDIAVRNAFAEVGLIVIPCGFEVIRDEGSIVTVVQTYRIVDSDSGESFECQMGGMGQDSGDKRIYKAETGAFKYLMKQLLQIPAQETDPDNFPSEAVEKPVLPNGNIDWRNYVLPVVLKKHAGKTLEAVANEDMNYIKYFATKQGSHQPYFQAALGELNG